jgi:uncharacterized membrane protein
METVMSRRAIDLTAPRGRTRLSIHYDPERFGRFSEAIATLLGTATYLVGQTVIVIVWILVNVFAVRLRWDPYPFILLNLLFSTQASYAAPLIADTEYLARELTAVRLALTELPTRAELTERIDRLERQLALRSDT